MKKKVLVAVDGSEYSEKAFKRSLEEAEEIESKLTILKVVESFEYGGDTLEEALENQIENAEELTEKLKNQAEEKGVEAEAKVITGSNTATAIVKFADKNDSDLIVVGSRGKTGLETITLGSVSEGVVKRAHCPVLIVR